jgi:hypothetical protein
MKNKIVLLILSWSLFFSVGGCSAKMPPPLKDISNAKMSLAKARDANAQVLAKKSFKLAVGHYKKIKVFMEKQKFKKAKYAAQKAQILANLAYAKAEKMKVKERVDMLNGEVNTIKKEFTTISQ